MGSRCAQVALGGLLWHRVYSRACECRQPYCMLANPKLNSSKICDCILPSCMQLQSTHCRTWSHQKVRTAKNRFRLPLMCYFLRLLPCMLNDLSCAETKDLQCSSRAAACVCGARRESSSHDGALLVALALIMVMLVVRCLLILLLRAATHAAGAVTQKSWHSVVRLCHEGIPQTTLSSL